MRKPEEKKTVRKTVLMTEALSNEIEEEAKNRGIKPNAVMNERLKHPGSDNKPSFMAAVQDFTNKAVKAVAKYSEPEAKELEKAGNKLWTY